MVKNAEWTKGGFFLAGNVEGSNLNIPSEAVRTVNLTSPNGQVIKILAVATNNYSKENTNYSGFQVIITPAQLKEAVKGTTYKMSLGFYYDGAIRNIQLLNPNNITVGEGNLGFQISTENGIEVLIEQ